ncbi:MAG: esterase family protein [Lachnospiraceae bacterium]|nr:esterase family protein [Lachnospiraceae bacterium]
MALLHVNFFSEVLGMSMNMDVILPQKTQRQIGMEGNRKDGKYPTLYLLHGMSDDHTIWQRRTSIERYVSEMGIAVVMPNVHLSFYTDMHYGLKYWTFVSEELPAICRDFFPNMSEKKEDTFVAGLSMGGYGAFKLALGASDTFGAAASLSGALDMAAEAAQWAAEQSPQQELFYHIFGPYEQVSGSDNDLLALARKLKDSGKKLPKLYMWCGTEDFLYEHNQTCRMCLQELGYDLVYEESAGGHSWDYWDEKIQTVLKWLPIRK